MERTRERTRTLSGGLMRGLLVSAAAAAVIAACVAPSGATTAPTVAPATQAPATEPAMSPPPATAAAAELTLELATDATLGAHVTGEDGLSLYIFTPDIAAPNKSSCTGDCAATWPPLTVEAASDVAAGTGVTGSLGTITRDDGTLQVTLGGSPLYYFASDAAAGDIEGQGIGGVWYLAGPDGKGVGIPRGEDPEY